MSQIDRRSFLKAGGALAAVALTSCSDTKPASAGLNAAGPDWTGFRRGLTGKLYRPGETGYAAAHQVFNPRFDSIQPAGVVRISTVDDVRESILFARKNKLVCVPKGGGHSYVGGSTVSNGLVVDVGNARGLSYAKGVVTIGAGAKLYDVHAFLDKYGQSLPTGTCPTVGIAGLTLGGGMGIHTRTYGLTHDRVASIQLVTADGVFKTVSATQEPELFWALRGSGGGNFGIVTSFRINTIPAAKLGFFRLTWPEAKAAAVVRGWQRFAHEAPSSSWGNLHIDAQSNGSLSIHILGVSTTGSAAAAAAQVESFVGSKATTRSITVKTHMESVKYLGGGTTSPRTGFLAGSDVLRGAMDAATINGLLGAVKAAARAKVPAAAILDPFGGQSAKEPAAGTAWPWRSALGVIQWYCGTPAHPTSAQLAAAQKFVTAGHHAVTKASAGGYVNYVEAGRSVNSYYGAKLGRLHAAKKKYDPTGFFRTSYTLT